MSEKERRTTRTPYPGRALLAVAVALAAACAGKSGKKAAGAAGAAGGAAGGGLEPDIRGVEFVAASGLETVHFEFGRHSLDGEAREVLKKNAAVIKKNPAWQVLVEGHCDERGTVAFNFALGQQRAKAVRDYYVALGVSGERVATLSLGEERPACAESTESCWARNRRAEHKVRTDAPASEAAKR